MSARRGQPAKQLVDPTVSRSKFDREIAAFVRNEREYRAQGCLLVKAGFPTAELIIGPPRLRPFAVFYGVLLDFTNFDAIPPSVQLINPWTSEPLRMPEVTMPLPRGDGTSRIIQAFAPPHDMPFLCTRGIREYHFHPAHTGDSWWLSRGRGEGTLSFVADLLIAHGTRLVKQFTFEIASHLHKDPAGNWTNLFHIKRVGFLIEGEGFFGQAF